MLISSQASSALRPRWGVEAAWDVRPLNLKKTLRLAKLLDSQALLVVPGCQVKQASTSSK